MFAINVSLEITHLHFTQLNQQKLNLLPNVAVCVKLVTAMIMCAFSNKQTFNKEKCLSILY